MFLSILIGILGVFFIIFSFAVFGIVKKLPGYIQMSAVLVSVMSLTLGFICFIMMKIILQIIK